MNWLALALWALISAPFHPAHAQFLPLGVAAPQAAAGYTGDLDTSPSGIHGWWGLEAASTADRGTAAVNVCLPSDSACADVATDATTGQITSTIVTAAGLSTCNIGVVNCTIKIFYNKGAGGGGDMAQATEANRYRFGVPGNCPGALATFYCADAWNTGLIYVDTSASHTCPCSLMGVFYDTAGGAYNTVVSTTPFNPALYANSGKVDFYASSDQTITSTATLNTWYMAVGLSGASGYINANGTSQAATNVIAGATVVDAINSESSAPASPFSGFVFKAGVWDAPGVSSADAATIITNTRARLGF